MLQWSPPLSSPLLSSRSYTDKRQRKSGQSTRPKQQVPPPHPTHTTMHGTHVHTRDDRTLLEPNGVPATGRTSSELVRGTGFQAPYGRRSTVFGHQSVLSRSGSLSCTFRCSSNCSGTSSKCFLTMLAKSCSNNGEWLFTMNSQDSRSKMLPTHEA